MNNFKTILTSLTFLLISTSLFSQSYNEDIFRIKNSLKIFEKDSVVSQSNDPFQRDKKYYFKLYDCQRYLFRDDGSVVFENACPGDYITRTLVGNYAYSSDTQIELTVDTLGNKGFNLERLFVDRIDIDTTQSMELAFKIYDLDKRDLGTNLSISYKKKPFFFRETKTLSFRHDDINSLVGKKIYLESIAVEAMKDDVRKVYYFPINQAIELESNTYKIYLRKKWGRINKIKNKLWLFYWNHTKQEYLKEDELIFNYLQE